MNFCVQEFRKFVFTSLKIYIYWFWVCATDFSKCFWKLWIECQELLSIFSLIPRIKKFKLETFANFLSKNIFIKKFSLLKWSFNDWSLQYLKFRILILWKILFIFKTVILVFLINNWITINIEKATIFYETWLIKGQKQNLP